MQHLTVTEWYIMCWCASKKLFYC